MPGIELVWARATEASEPGTVALTAQQQAARTGSEVRCRRMGILGYEGVFDAAFSEE